MPMPMSRKSFLRLAVVVFSSAVLWPVLVQACLSSALDPCPNGPDITMETQASHDADVIFRAKALATRGTDTEMKVLEVRKGAAPLGTIVFRHPAKPKKPELCPR